LPLIAGLGAWDGLQLPLVGIGRPAEVELRAAAPPTAYTASPDIAALAQAIASRERAHHTVSEPPSAASMVSVCEARERMRGIAAVVRLACWLSSTF
jgi:hypothetical protein